MPTTDNNIVAGLFGISPQQAYQQQQAQQNAQAAQAFNSAGGTPGQLMAQAYSNAGSSALGLGAGMMGIEPTAVVEARKRQELMQGIDMSTSAGLKEKANQFAQAGDQEMALKLIMLANKREAELAKANSESSPFAKINPKDYTPESLRKYMQSKNPSDLEAQTPDGKISQIGRELIDAGYVEGSPEFISEMRKRISAKDEGSRKGGGTTVVMPGEKNAIDIPKFEQSVQGTIKPHLETVTAADMATAALKNSMKTGNYSSFNAAKQQLARAFSDGTISRAEVVAAGADPSMIGGIVDATSTLFTGTPSTDTQKKMLKTLEIAKNVAANKGQTALTRMKKVGEMSGIKKDQLDTLLTFPEFDDKSNNSASSDDALIQKHLKKKPR